MRIFILFGLLLFVCSCTIETGKVSPERKKLYDYNNNDAYCQKYPDRCVNNVPW